MCHVHSTKPFNLEVVWGDHTKIREECICKVVWNGFSKVTSKNNFQAFSVISPGMAVSSILQIRFDRIKDCNTIQGGERINSRVIRSDCYSFRVLSYPDSSTISGKDTSCPNKIISQVSWLKWTCSKGRVPGGAQHPALHTTSTMDTDHCAGGMSHFGGWEKWSCSDSGTTAAWKNCPIWTIQSYLWKKEVHVFCSWNSMNIFGKDPLMKGTSWTL